MEHNDEANVWNLQLILAKITLFNRDYNRDTQINQFSYTLM